VVVYQEKNATICCIGRNGIWTAVKSGCRSNLKIGMVGAKILKKMIFSAKFERGFPVRSDPFLQVL